MNDNDIQQSWEMLNRRLERLEEHTMRMAQDVTRRRTESLQQRLTRRYKMQACVGLLLPVLAPMFTYLDLPVWLACCYALLGLLLGCAHLAMAFYISSQDYTSMPTVKAMAHAGRIIRRQWQLQFLSLAATVPVIVAIFYELAKLNEDSLLYGATIGLIVGGIIGLYKAIVNFKLSRQLARTLENDLEQ